MPKEFAEDEETGDDKQRVVRSIVGCLPFQVTPGGDGLFVRRQSVRVSCLDVCLASRMLYWCYGRSLITT